MFAQSLYVLTLFMLDGPASVRLRTSADPMLSVQNRVSWWAVSFPLAAAAIASLRYAIAQPNMFTNSVAVFFARFVTLVIAALLGRSAHGIIKGELRHLSS